MRIIFANPLAIFAIFAILMTSCKKTNDTLVHVIKDEYNIEDQREIGKSLKKLIFSSPDRFPVLNQNENVEIYQYLNELIDMAANTEIVENRLAFNWDLTIIQDDNVVTTFITPGGHLFIYTGLLKFLTSESELFSVLAHEINYADSENLMKRLVSDFGKDVMGDILLGHDLPETRNVAFQLSSLIFKESDVLIADRYALTLICPFQYDAFGLKTFLEAAKTSNLEIQWLVTHPSSITRIENIEEYAANCGFEEETFVERYTEYKSLLP